MTGRIIRTIALLTALILAGCAGKGNPTTPDRPDLGKEGQNFAQGNVFNVFGEPNEIYNDIDTSVLIQSYQDLPKTIDDHTWTAFVTLKEDADNAELFRPFCRWVSDGPKDDAIMTDPIEVDTGLENDESCRFVKCSAKYTSDDRINLVVCYQVLVNGSWDIHATNLS